MKNFKKLLLIAIAAISFAACSDGDDDEPTKSQTFVGTITVKADGLDDFTMKDVNVDAVCDKENKICNLTIKQVTFAQTMADHGMLMDCDLNGANYTVSGNDTILNGKDVAFVATMQGQSGDFGYSVPTLEGKLDKASLNITTSVASQRGSYVLTFSGKRK